MVSNFLDCLKKVLFLFGLVSCQPLTTTQLKEKTSIDSLSSKLEMRTEVFPMSSKASLKKECYVNHKIPSMGTFFEVQMLIQCEKSNNSDLVLHIKNKLEKLEAELSLYQEQSALSELNRLGSVRNVSKDFINILNISFEHYEKTDGVFNVAIYPVIEETKRQLLQKKSPKNLNRLRKLLDLKNVSIEGANVKFKVGGMKLSFDGIAKGFAVDAISNFLEQNGVKNYLVNFSGNMRWLGHREDGQIWKIAIWDPVAEKTVSIEDRQQGAIASSGVDYNYYSKNKKWHHIIDPNTLTSANRNLAATVVGPSATICDVLSTSTFIFKQKQRERIYKENYPEYGFWVRTKNNQIFTFQL